MRSHCNTFFGILDRQSHKKPLPPLLMTMLGQSGPSLQRPLKPTAEVKQPSVGDWIGWAVVRQHSRTNSQNTYCQSLRICPRCSSPLRNATWQVLQVNGCDDGALDTGVI